MKLERIDKAIDGLINVGVMTYGVSFMLVFIIKIFMTASTGVTYLSLYDVLVRLTASIICIVATTIKLQK